MKVKIIKKKKEENKKEIFISSEYIKLDSFLKYASVVNTGGEAKYIIQNENIYVNGERCVQRGKKLKPEDTVEINGFYYIIKKKNES